MNSLPRIVRKNTIWICFLFILLTIADPLKAETDNIEFAGTDWCPYTCDNDIKPGFITEYGKYLFSNIGIKLNVTLLPWERAMYKAKSGRYAGLITASSLEAEGLNRTINSTTSYQMCFYVLADSQWQYQGVESLKNITLGAIRGYSYGEPVDSYLSKKSDKVFLLAGNDPHIRLKTMLEKKRLGALIGDKLVLKYKIGDALDKLKIAGCLDPNQLYFAFNKKISPEIIKKIDNELMKSKSHTRLNHFMSKYLSIKH